MSRSEAIASSRSVNRSRRASFSRRNAPISASDLFPRGVDVLDEQRGLLGVAHPGDVDTARLVGNDLGEDLADPLADKPEVAVPDGRFVLVVVNGPGLGGAAAARFTRNPRRGASPAPARGRREEVEQQILGDLLRLNGERAG